MFCLKFKVWLSLGLAALIGVCLVWFGSAVVESDSENLTRSQSKQLAANCLDIQIQALKPSRDKLMSKERKKYKAILSESEYYLRLIGYKSRQIGQDASELNLALVKNWQLSEQFDLAVEQYRSIVTEIVNMDCKPNINLFAENLRIAKEKHRQLIEAGLAIQQFATQELIDYLDSFEKNLIEAN